MFASIGLFEQETLTIRETADIHDIRVWSRDRAHDAEGCSFDTRRHKDTPFRFPQSYHGWRGTNKRTGYPRETVITIKTLPGVKRTAADLNGSGTSAGCDARCELAVAAHKRTYLHVITPFREIHDPGGRPKDNT